MMLPKWDNVRQDGGHTMGLHLIGHALNDDEAVAYAWSIILEEGYGIGWNGEPSTVTLDPPRRLWVRKIPGLDYDGYPWISYRYQTFPGRGAQAVTLIDFTSGWLYRCDLLGCENHYVKGGAKTGFPVEQFIDPPVNRQDERNVYLCQRHGKSFSERRDAAVKARMAEWYAERDAAGAA